MPRSIKTHYWVLYPLLLILFSCRRDSKQPTVDTPIKASFSISEPLYGSLRQFPTDTIVTYAAVFTGEGRFDSCKWKIGSDPTIRTTRSFALNFPKSESGQTIPVVYTAYRDGKSDAITKNVTVMGLKGTTDDNQTSFTVQPAFLGKFLGSYQDAPSHLFEVSIVNFGTYPAQTNGAFFWEFRLFNLPEGCGGTYTGTFPCTVSDITPYHYSYGFQTSYKAFFVNEGNEVGCCPPAAIYGYTDAENPKKIIIEYNQLKNISITQVDTVVRKKFIGYKQ